VYASAAWAEKIEITPFLNVTHTYTDNVTLAPEGSELSDSVTQLVPGISIAGTGPRMSLSAYYAPEVLLSSRLDREDNVFHRGSATANLELARKLFYVDTGAKIDQYEISLRGPIGSNVNVTDNRATLRTSYIAPYVLRDFGAAARGEARVTLSALRADDPAIADNDAGRVNLRLESGPAYKLFTWRLAYAKETIEYELGQEAGSEEVTANARLLVSPSVGLLAQVGSERYESGAAASEIEGSRWNLGLEWTPTPRTRVAAIAGKRFDDNSYSFDFRHRTRLTTWTATYSEDITSARSQFFLPSTASTAGFLDPLFASQFPDPIERQKAIEQFIARTGLPANLATPVNFFSEQLFLQKRWLASLGIQGVRNTVVASVFAETREVLFSSLGLPAGGDFAFSDSIRLAGGSLAWTWRMTPRLSWNFEAGYARNEFLDTVRVDEYSSLRAGITREFQPRISGSLSVRRQESQSTLGLNVYVEHAVVAAVQTKF
jgi:uncharacterized protein (PEP-CTERM system associated)